MNKNPTRYSELSTVVYLDAKTKGEPRRLGLGNLALIYQPGILAALALVSFERCLCTCWDLVSQINNLCHLQ